MVIQRSPRHQIRQLRRHGVQPMAVLSPADALADAAVLVVARLAWRYRSELTPVGTAVLAEFLAWLLHARSPHAWPIVAAVTGALAVGAVFAGARLGLTDRSERIYAAVIAMAAGVWIAAATVAGPKHRTIQLVLLLGGLTLAIPWWAHRRRRAKVRVERKLAAWPEVSRAVGLAGSRFMSAVVDTWGWKARFALGRGQTIGDVISRLPAIESALGTYRGAVRAYPTSDNQANRFELRVLDRDPHADAIAWPGPSVATITEPIDFGPFEDARPCRVLLLRRHALFGGVSGSGKSGGLNVLMGNLAACMDAVIWAIDLKRGMELGPWAACIARLATTPAEARALLADAVAVLEARAAHLAMTGKRIWEPAPESPALVIIFDEYAELAETVPSAAADADSVARRGRAVAVTMIAATQRPTQKAMGQGALRSQMDVRISFRVRERKDADLILGQGMLAAGWHAHTLNAPGKFLISAPEHDSPRRARAYLVTDQAVAETSARHARVRPELDDVSQQAIAGRAQAQPGDQAGEPAQWHIHDAQGAPERDLEAPDTHLWAALCAADDDGAGIDDLLRASGMSRPTLYRRLAEHVRAGRVTQVSRGRWRARLAGEPGPG